MEYTKSSQQLIKESNMKTVFSLIHQLDGVSRADIKKLTKLSATTVSSLVEELIESSLVLETGVKEAKNSGRKAISLSANAKGGYFAVVMVSAHHFRLKLFDLCYDEILKCRERYDNEQPLSKSLAEFLSKHLQIENNGKLLGIVVGIPGIIDNEQNIVYSTVLNLYEGDNLYSNLSAVFSDTSVLICSSSALTACGEKEFGDNDAETLVSIDISEGVGAAAIIGNTPYMGSSGLAGEFGHITVDINGEKCRCGNRGCIETVASIPAILKKASEICKCEVTLLELRDKILENNELKNYMDYVVKVLSSGINNLLNIIDPDAVVLCGDITVLGEEFAEKLRASLSEISLPGRNFSLKVSTLGEDAEFKGGAKYIFEFLFKQNKKGLN